MVRRTLLKWKLRVVESSPDGGGFTVRVLMTFGMIEVEESTEQGLDGRVSYGLHLGEVGCGSARVQRSIAFKKREEHCHILVGKLREIRGI